VQIQSTQESLNELQNRVFRRNEEIDQFKMQMNWNQEQLEQWCVHAYVARGVPVNSYAHRAMAAKQKEEDTIALQKYTRADESKTRELTQQVLYMLARACTHVPHCYRADREAE
jgi:hypothetical protein